MPCTEQNSPAIDCEKSLDNMEEVEALKFLVSIKPEKQIAALASARKEVRQTIMNRIEPPARRAMYRSMAASKMPPELWDNVTSNLSSFSTENAANVFQFKLTEEQEIHECVWRTIFKGKEEGGEEWPQFAFDKYNTNLVLLGPDIPSIPEKIKKKEHMDIYMVLLANDWSGDLFWDGFEDGFMKFRNSLQEHTYNKETQEISFSSGIKLNITQVITGCEEIEMPDLQVLLEKDNVQTAYCSWIDPKKQIKTLKECDIVGIGGRITKPSSVNPICGISLSHPKQHGPGQQVFASTPTWCTRTTLPPYGDPIYREGEKYPLHRTQGWETRYPYEPESLLNL